MSCVGTTTSACSFPNWRTALAQYGVNATQACDYRFSASTHLWYYRCASTCVGYGTATDACPAANQPTDNQRTVKILECISKEAPAALALEATKEIKSNGANRRFVLPAPAGWGWVRDCR